MVIDYTKQMKVKDIAEFLLMSESWVYKHIKKGDIPHIHAGKGPRAPLRFNPLKVKQWFESLHDNESDGIDWR